MEWGSLTAPQSLSKISRWFSYLRLWHNSCSLPSSTHLPFKYDPKGFASNLETLIMCLQFMQNFWNVSDLCAQATFHIKTHKFIVSTPLMTQTSFSYQFTCIFHITSCFSFSILNQQKDTNCWHVNNHLNVSIASSCIMAFTENTSNLTLE